jgi:FkbM family methyltransferase
MFPDEDDECMGPLARGNRPVMHLSLPFCKPWYIFRPAQILRRLCWYFRGRHTGGEWGEVLLPWGLAIRFHPHDVIGSAIATIGLYDLTVSEVLYRLLDRGELAIDVGANIGHMTSIMALRVGRTGTVEAFEPHPDLFEELTVNVTRWRKHVEVGAIILHEAALSDRRGSGLLTTPTHFEKNRGTAYLCSVDQVHRNSGCPVRVERLDQLVGNKAGLLKLDVEGHEYEVLKGAEARLRSQAIRDIVFEEHRPCPTPVTQLLASWGYKLFSLDHGFWGPKIAPIAGAPAPLLRNPPNYLATVDPARALARLRPIGWNVLGIGPSCRWG